jgi:hypothetical protein
MQTVIHWLTTNANVLAILITVGVAVLVVCCIGCTNCSCREKDEFFRRHQA